MGVEAWAEEGGTDCMAADGASSFMLIFSSCFLFNGWAGAVDDVGGGKGSSSLVGFLSCSAKSLEKARSVERDIFMI